MSDVPGEKVTTTTDRTTQALSAPDWLVSLGAVKPTLNLKKNQ